MSGRRESDRLELLGRKPLDNEVKGDAGDVFEFDDGAVGVEVGGEFAEESTVVEEKVEGDEVGDAGLVCVDDDDFDVAGGRAGRGR